MVTLDQVKVCGNIGPVMSVGLNVCGCIGVSVYTIP